MARGPTGVCAVVTCVAIGVTVGVETVAVVVGRVAEAVVVGYETDGGVARAGGTSGGVPEGSFAPHAERIATLVAPATIRKTARRSNCREDRVARSPIVA